MASFCPEARNAAPPTEGTVPLAVAYDTNERSWNPAAPLLFQRVIALENRPIPAAGIRGLLNGALAASGITGTDGKPLTFWPHDFRRVFTTIDPAQRHRLEEIRDNLHARIAEAEREGWAGEAEGLKVSLAAANSKLTQADATTARRAEHVHLSIPAYRDIAAATLTTPGDPHEH